MRRIGEDIERLDATLASLARKESALRLRLGQVLEVMSRGGCFELGFSSIAAYSLERCERSVRWAEAARCLARRVEKLPGLRRAMVRGEVSRSMGELLARVARPDDEARWVELAESRTVRQMRALVSEAMARVPQAGAVVELDVSVVGKHAGGCANAGGCAHPDDDAECDHCDGCSDCDEICTLTCTVEREDAWLFEATRSLLDQLGARGTDAQAEALLAEGQEKLLRLLPRGTLDPERMHDFDMARQRWLSELRRWRGEAEALCEQNIRDGLLEGRVQHRNSAPRRHTVAVAAALGMASLEQASGEALDAHVRALSEGLARHELELSVLALRFHRADGWRRLGYATETQYARERLGLSRSSLLARRLLALRLEKLPSIAAALGAGQVGVEAALQVARVATANTEAAWVQRARTRTIKHLREEVAAALSAVRWSGELDCPPPVDAEMTAFHALEQAVVSGRVYQVQSTAAARDARPSDPSVLDARWLVEPASDRRAWFVMLGSLAAWLEGGFQTSAERAVACSPARSSAGRVTLRLRMSRANYSWWCGLEAQARPWLPRRMSWLRFLCLSLWHAWRHLLGTEVAYAQIYIRDRYRCTSPVCNRRDVTPHHLRFRSAGGSDHVYNITSVCTWCHLCGVHGGRIRARGTARLIHWEFGAPSSPCIVVHGRERLAA
jgi:hypothetical protein